MVVAFPGRRLRLSTASLSGIGLCAQTTKILGLHAKRFPTKRSYCLNSTEVTQEGSVALKIDRIARFLDCGADRFYGSRRADIIYR